MADKQKQYHGINLKEETYNRLLKYIHLGQTVDGAIQELMDKVDGVQNDRQ